MAIQVKNGSKRLVNEIWELRDRNRPLLKLLLDLRNFVKKNYGKDIVLTMIYRTDEEQHKIYTGKVRNGRLFDQKPWKSPHQFYHAFDLRSKNFTKEQINEIENYLNNKYNDTNYYKFTAKDHNVGLGNHFHIQYLKV